MERTQANDLNTPAPKGYRPTVWVDIVPRFQLIESGRLHVSHIIRDLNRGLDYPTNAPQLAERAVANIIAAPSKYAASPTADDAYMAGRHVKDVVS